MLPWISAVNNNRLNKLNYFRDANDICNYINF